MSGFVCANCERPAPVHVWLGESTWNGIKPHYPREGDGCILCLYCMSERLSSYGYKDGSVGLSISNGPFCNMKWGSITEPYEKRIAELEGEVAALKARASMVGG